jgi:hypothetical protein
MAVFKKKPRNQQASDVPLVFTPRDAQRIANTVHAYETSRRGRRPSILPRASGGGGGGGGGGVDEAFFVGAWVKGQSKQITFIANTAATAAAFNMIRTIPISYSGATARLCTVSVRSLPNENGQLDYVLINSEC